MRFSFRTAFLAVYAMLCSTQSAKVQAKMNKMMMGKTMQPSSKPSSNPSQKPSGRPSAPPSAEPSLKPSVSAEPSTAPSQVPSTQPSRLNCIDTAVGVQDAINNNQELIVLCPDTEFSINPIDLTDKGFDMRCLKAPSQGQPFCGFTGGNGFFYTSFGVKNVKFYGIGFKNAKSFNVGGAVAFSGSGNVEFDSCLFENNDAGTSGGAIYIGAGTAVVVTNTVFRKNSAGQTNSFRGKGGAVYVSAGGTLTVGTSTFTDNTVKDDTTSSSVGRGPHILKDASFADNEAIVNCLPGNSFSLPDNPQQVKQTAFDSYVDESCP